MSADKRGGGQAEGVRMSTEKTRRHQVHFWVGSRDHDFLLAIAEKNGDTVSAVLRRLIRAARVAGMRQPESQTEPREPMARVSPGGLSYSRD